MWNVICALVYLFCRSGCRATSVASALTFHPPDPPHYEFITIDDGIKSGSCESIGESGLKGSGNDQDQMSQQSSDVIKYSTVFSPELPHIPAHLAALHSSHLLETEAGTHVPVMLWVNPNAQVSVVHT
jgi:hypothetical protein